MTADGTGAVQAEAAGRGSGRKRLLVVCVPLLLVGAGAGLWFGGVLPPPFGQTGQDARDATGEGATPVQRPRPPVFLDMPEMVANLNAPGRRPMYVKLRSKLELAGTEDAATVSAALPRVLDLFATYLREMRPEELRGSAGTHRLREELVARANLAVAPARVNDILFMEILIQ